MGERHDHRIRYPDHARNGRPHLPFLPINAVQNPTKWVLQKALFLTICVEYKIMKKALISNYSVGSYKNVEPMRRTPLNTNQHRKVRYDRRLAPELAQAPSSGEHQPTRGSRVC
jgi:hypothetical protein